MSKATLYLDDTVHDALRMKAAETKETMSELVNDALKILLSEDLEDIKDWKERKGDKSFGYEEFLEQLKKDGTI